jgi:UPF0755 protein
LVLLLVLLVLVSGVAVAANRYRSCKNAPDGAAKDVRFTVAAGANATQVLGDLVDAELVRCGGFVGSLLIRGTGKASEIRAGSYTLTRGMSLDEIMTVLTTPPPKVATANVLVPPGYRVSQTAAAFQQDLGLPANAFIAAAESGRYSLAPYLPKGSPTVEGFLFPETYRFTKKGTTPDVAIRRLIAEFGTRVADLPWANARKLGLTPYEVVVVASMIEEEARIEADRGNIAGVIYNRLNAGMTLGIDATVGYIDPDPSDGLTTADFEIDSAYNTRLNPGLPPTPIASPGLDSLRAALEPANVGYLYYVACGTDGGHRFSTDYARFLSDKAECLG